MARPQTPLNTWGKINVEKKKNGEWLARGRYRDFTGKKHDWTATDSTKVGAEQKLRAKSDAFVAGAGGTLTSEMTVEALFHAWIEDKQKNEDLGKHAADDYEQVWRLHLRERFGRLSLREVTTGAIHDHINSLSKSNSRRGRVVLNGMFDLAERLDIIQRNPVRATKRKKERAKAVQALSLDQIDRVRSAIYKHDKTRRGPKSGYTLSDFFDIMIGTGLRPGELLALQWSDINLRYKGSKVTISVTGTLQYRDGKQKGPLIKSEYPKTDASIRTFIVPGYVATILRRLHRNRSITPTNAVFHTRSGGFVSLNNIDRALRNVREDLDLEWMTAHTFRKTAATHITEELGEEQAARVLGHNDPAVTRKYYIDKTRFTGDATPALERLGPDYRASHLRVVAEGEEVNG